MSCKDNEWRVMIRKVRRRASRTLLGLEVRLR
jgi:hypothetical protein